MKQANRAGTSDLVPAHLPEPWHWLPGHRDFSVDDKLTAFRPASQPACPGRTRRERDRDRDIHWYSSFRVRLTGRQAGISPLTGPRASQCSPVRTLNSIFKKEKVGNETSQQGGDNLK